MKKCFLKATGLLTIASALLLASCSDGSNDYDGRVDTVINLKTPSVTAKAYPGVNLVSWDVVPGAEKYEVYRYETGNATDKDIVQTGVNVQYVDTDVQNNVSYTYEVMARGNVSTRKVVTFDSATGKATVTGILPPASTKALDLAAYEDGYDGKNEKTLSPAEQKNGLKETAKVCSYNGKIRVTFNAKSYLKYGVYTTNRNNYEVTQVASTRTNHSTVVNNSVLPVNATVTTAGTYKVYVKAVAMNSHFPESKFLEVGEVTYDALSGSVSNVSAGYIDAGKTVRVKFTPATENDVKTETADYKVYRNSFDTDLVEVTGLVKALSEDTFFVDDVIADNSIGYTYTIVYTDGTKFGTAAPTVTVNAYSLTQTDAVTVASEAKTLDADLLANDIKWTVTLANVDQTFEAYVLTINKDDKLESFTPVAADFTEKLEGWKVEGDITAKRYYNYSANVPVGKTYLCVKVSEEGKKDIYVISAAVTVNAAIVSAPSISVAKYDNSYNGATADGTARVDNDVIVNVTDTIANVDTDSIANYTYTLYRTSSTVKTDVPSITFTANIADWEKVADITMKPNEAYDPSQTEVDYIGTYEIDDVADGTYAYKVVKTNKAGVSKSSGIAYVNINTAPSATISYTPNIGASFVDGTKATSNVKITWTKNIQDLTAEYGTGKLAGLVVRYVGQEADEDITYTLYRATLSATKTELVYEKVAGVSAAPNENKHDENVSFLDADGNVDSKTIKVVDSIDYTFTDKDLDTGASYSYIVVASKASAKDKISDPVSVRGAN